MRSDVCHTRHGFQDANLLRHLGNIFRIIIFSKAKKKRTCLDVPYAHFKNSGHNYDLRFE